MTDIRIENGGTIFLFVPLTPKGKHWLETSTETESWQWLGNNLAVEHRYARELAQYAIDDGLEVE